VAGDDAGPLPNAQSDEVAPWLRELHDVPALIDLPVRVGDPTAPRDAVDAVRRVLVEDLAARIDEFCVTHGCRPEAVLLAGYAAAVAFWANHPLLAVGVAFRDPRPDHQDRRVLPVRAAVDDHTTFDDLVDRVRGALASAPVAGRVGLADICAALRLEPAEGSRPFAQIIFDHDDGATAAGADAEARPGGPGPSTADLTLRTARYGARFELTLSAPRARYDRSDLDELADRLVTQLGSALARPDSVLSRQPYAPADEAERIATRWQGPVYPPPADSTAARIAKVAESAPARTAVVGASGSLTYADLMAHARQVARQLHEHGLGGRTVAVCLERDLHWLPAILGIWLAGCVYLPLNTEWPAARMDLVLTDADVGGVLVSERTRSLEGLAGRRRIVLAPPAGPVDPGPEVGAGIAAYVLYTSGSTGRPKGVVVEQPALGNLLDGMVRLLGLGPDDSVLAASAPTFDISLVEYLLPLMVGGTCVVADDNAARDPALLAAMVARHRITVVQATPSMWSLLLEHRPGRLRVALAGGETVTGDLRDRLCRLADRAFNGYGPTEATIYATAWEMAEGIPVSIGRPLSNVRAWVLDHWRRPCSVGAIGELVLGGAGIAREYLNQPGRTAQAFHHGIEGLEAGWVYRTGDLASWGPDGQLYLHGRVDSQIKLRGVRIEPGEVEVAVRAVDGVRDCAVVAYRHSAGAGLAAFVVAVAQTPGDALDADLEGAVRARVAEVLPHYTRPQLYLNIDRLPRSSSGKLDRATLAELAAGRFADRAPARAAPGDPLVDTVRELWREVLGVAVVEGESHFFSLGGDSLSGMRVVARVNRTFGTQLAIADLVRNPTLHAFARLVAGGAGDRAPKG
jgi:amino acid adenylation domain-containing protein